MGIINVTSDRKNVTLDSDVILYILMNGKIAEIHIVGGRVYETRTALKDLEGLLYTVRKKKQILAEIQEKQKNMINALEKKVFRLRKKNIAVIIVLLNICPLHLQI